MALLMCIGCGGERVTVRSEKEEYLAHIGELGDRFETLEIGVSDTIDLAAKAGLYGYVTVFIPLEASVGAGTLEVCVSSTGSTGVTYFPHFPPGFDFVDTDPGCTEITNPDPTLENDVLIELSGTGTATTTTRLIP